MSDAELRRLAADARREDGANWKRWGPYLSERQWGTVREDYSPDGESWEYFPHDHARSRACRWGEDGLLGITDRECRLCFALALWNERDTILKERLFGLSGKEGNHGEDVKEYYFYLDSAPTHSYLKALYKYPQSEYPYALLVDENRRRGRTEPEFELLDTGIFDDRSYFDVLAEYAKCSPNDILIRLTVANRGSRAARLHLLPTIWFRNTWSWGCRYEGCWPKPSLRQEDERRLIADHVTLGSFHLTAGAGPDGKGPDWLFTENETNAAQLFGAPNQSDYCKDAFHQYLVSGNVHAVNPQCCGTKAAAHYILDLPAASELTVRLRLSSANETLPEPLCDDFDVTFLKRISETEAFYAARIPSGLSDDERRVMRQAYAGLLWTKQFYHYVVSDWLQGDPAQPPVDQRRKQGRNHDWTHLFNRDVLSVPDKWEYPWYAAWDAAFHVLPLADLDSHFAQEQLILFLREWYMHPNGQLPAYEFGFGDVNPPVHAWACWQVYQRTGRDRLFLARVFQKLLLNFTWWVNRKDHDGNHLFSGGFLGLDNIGIFDRSKPLPTGGHLEQADGTAWMAFYCSSMLRIALELAVEDPAYGDMASKFFEHFIAIADAINELDGTGLWDEQDGFYYDHLHADGGKVPLRVRSMVGIIPLFAVTVLDEETIQRLPGFRKRMEWFLEHRKDLARRISCMERDHPVGTPCGKRLLAIPSRERLERVLSYVLNEDEFLSTYGVRSLSRIHRQNPFSFRVDGLEHRIEYVPGESDSGMFGGNSNWRGPIWFPVNCLLIEALRQYDSFFEDALEVEYPTGSRRMLRLADVACELEARLLRIFLPDEHARRPCHGRHEVFADDPCWRNLVLFHEYFHGDDGCGHGASHQTGWTALVTQLLADIGPASMRS